MDCNETANAPQINIAHELRTYLASIRNYATSIDKGEPGTTPESHLTQTFTTDSVFLKARKIIEEVDRANKVIEMILIASSNNSSKQTKPCDINEVVRDAVDTFPYSNDTEAKMVSASIPGTFSVLGNEIALTHVIYNLIDNAIRFVQRGRGIRAIDITTDASNRTLTVADTGPGIPQSQIKHIFDRFYTTETYGQGTGIGLSFCKSTMESIGGSIECESVEGEYTKFTLTFP